MADAVIAQHVERFAETPSTGGTAIDNGGNVYLSDTNLRRVLKISPAGAVSVLISDPRLLWVDAMWVDADGFLWMPAAEINRLSLFQGGVSKVQYPVHVFKLQIGAKPPAGDHP